ncbi:MAG: hypothetical protein R3A44_29730 [Caldilineaceae bacterium]
MKKVSHFLLIGMLLFGAFFMAKPASQVSAKDSAKLLEFETMIGVPRPYTGPTNAIRGVPGGGLPWVIGQAKGELKSNGELEVKVKGLVFDPNDPDVIGRGLANQNTVPAFRVIVSCLSKDAAGNPTTVNVTTDQFPATTGVGAGDAEIEAHVALPSPCIAPIIFVTNPGGAWFAASGS